MMDTNDIVRKVAAEMLNTSMQDITAEVIYGWATRLGDAATCKKSLQVGNAAKMREALRKCANYLDVGDTGLCKGECDALREVMQAALSAPARNCDLYLTPKDAMLAHLDDVYEGEKVEFGDYEWCEFVKWLFAEAKGANDEQ